MFLSYLSKNPGEILNVDRKVASAEDKEFFNKIEKKNKSLIICNETLTAKFLDQCTISG